MKIVSADVTVSSRFRKEQRIILFTDHLYNQLFLSRNNGFPIRLRFSLASNHCPDLARDYRIASVSHHKATILLEKWTVSLSFPNFSSSTVTPECPKTRVIRDNDSASTLPFDSSLFNMDFDLPRSQDSRFQIWIFETIIRTESSPLTLIFRYGSAAPWPYEFKLGK